MKAKRRLISVVFMAAALVISGASFLEASPKTKISVFNFNATNLEATGYNTTVTNMLLNALG
ncbi:MAG TPA: hypothetical protein PLT64_04155, partial [Syntrophales bacterium]|nr:hypothetical protein [Syntrophales bacterium]